MGLQMEPWYRTYTSDNEIVYCDEEDFVVYKDTDGNYVAVGNHYGGLGSYSTLEEARAKKWDYYKWANAMDVN